MNDGCCYITPGFGVTTSGASAHAVHEAIGLRHMFSDIEKYLSSPGLVASIKQQTGLEDSCWYYEVRRDNNLFYAHETRHNIGVSLFCMDDISK